MDDLESLAAEIDREATVVALTGAGISAPSGVPTFRGDDGIWERFDQGQFAYGRFRTDPAGFWRDRVDLQRAMFGGEYEPNVAHEALAAMARDGYLEAICTQNTDGLHRQAAETARGAATAEPGADDFGERGVATDSDAVTDSNAVTDADAARSIADADSDVATDAGAAIDADAAGSDGGGDGATILELHGNARRVRCVDCGRRRDADPVFERAADGDLPPRCSCGGIFKPDVVLFGEQLPGAAIQRARTLASESDVFLAVGSSLVVEPAASLPRLAAANGATVAVVNFESTPCDGIADVVSRTDVTEALPRLRVALES